MKNYTITFPENYEKPKLEYRDRWCAALRSGEYKQGRQFLKERKVDKTFYCCLGVLCEIEGIKITDSHTVISNDWEKLYNDLDGIGYLPNKVSVFVTETQDRFYSLANLNDAAKLSFSDIADIIEAVWDQAES